MSPRERPPGDPFIVEPYSPREVRFHVTGGVLDGVCWLVAVAWLATAGRAAAPAWPWIVLAVLAGVYLADLASGLLHWAFESGAASQIADRVMTGRVAAVCTGSSNVACSNRCSWHSSELL